MHTAEPGRWSGGGCFWSGTTSQPDSRRVMRVAIHDEASVGSHQGGTPLCLAATAPRVARPIGQGLRESSHHSWCTYRSLCTIIPAGNAGDDDKWGREHDTLLLRPVRAVNATRGHGEGKSALDFGWIDLIGHLRAPPYRGNGRSGGRQHQAATAAHRSSMSRLHHPITPPAHRFNRHAVPFGRLHWIFPDSAHMWLGLHHHHIEM